MPSLDRAHQNWSLLPPLHHGKMMRRHRLYVLAEAMNLSGHHSERTLNDY